MYMTGGKLMRLQHCESCGRSHRTNRPKTRGFLDLCGECEAAFLKAGLSLRSNRSRRRG
jgi:hypothetical protein